MNQETSAELIQTDNDAVTFTLKLALALQSYGVPSHRLEEAMAMVNHRLGLTGQFFSSPSALFASFGTPPNQETYMLRGSFGNIDLEKMALLNRLSLEVAAGKFSASEGGKAVDAIVAAPNRYSGWLTIFCFMVASAGAGRLFGGGWREVLVAGLTGLGLGILLALAERSPAIGRILVPLAAVGAMLFAKSAALVFGPYSLYIATVTGLIVLIPGLSLTVAMTELATGHVVSGTARLANAGVTFLMLGFGLALGNLVPIVAPLAPPQTLPQWTEYLAIVFTPLAFVVLFKAKPRDAGWVFLAGMVAYFSARLGSQTFGPVLGSFGAALLLGLTANIFVRLHNRIGAVMLVPGIMLLVPGSIGFKSISSMLARETLLGVENAFSMVLVAVALVAGLVFSSVLISPKRPI